MKKCVSIGEMAELNKVTVQTLRLYCNKKLIYPVYVDPESGYRYFDINQSYIIDSIQFLQQIGLTLKEIKQYLEVSSPELALNYINRNLLLVEEHKKQLGIIENTMNFISKQIQFYSEFNNIDKVNYEFVEEKIIHTHTFDPVDFHKGEFPFFEYHLRDLKKKMIDSDINMSYFYNACSVISAENIRENRYLSHKIYIHGDYESSKILKSEIIPEGIYGILYFENFKEEPKYRQILLDDLENRGFHIEGDLLCEPVLDIPFFKNVERKSVLRLRIKISS